MCTEKKDRHAGNGDEYVSLEFSVLIKNPSRCRKRKKTGTENCRHTRTSILT